MECPSPIGLGLDLALAEAVLVEERAQRLEHEQRRALVALRLGGRLDDVVRCDGCTHRLERYTAIARAEPQPSRARSVSSAPCPESRKLLSTLLACAALAARALSGALGARLARPGHLLRGLQQTC